MALEQTLLQQATTLGYEVERCASCNGQAPACCNCGGSGRIWVDGPASLDDAGLGRLFALYQMMRPAQRSAFAPRGIPIAWIERNARSAEAAS
ncbi:MAG: hypothetical protein U0842_24520 [Candidatus Binatia bacterium]